MGAYTAGELAKDPQEALQEVRDGGVAVLTEEDPEHTPFGLVIPLRARDPEARIRLAATLLQHGAIGTGSAWRMAGCPDLESFLEATGRLGIEDLWTDTERASEDLQAAAHWFPPRGATG